MENPVRFSRFLSRQAARGFALGAVLFVTVLGCAWLIDERIPGLAGQGAAATVPELTLPAGPTPTAASSTTATTTPGEVTTTTQAWVQPDPPQGQLAELIDQQQQLLETSTRQTAVPSNLDPPLARARERSKPYEQGCVNIGRNPQLQPCEFGVTSSSTVVVLYGDSKAVQWFEPLEAIALDRGYRLVLLIKGGCPVADVGISTAILSATCPPYRDAAMAWIASHDPDLVIVANSYTQYPADADEWASGTLESLERLSSANDNVVLIGDNVAADEDPPDCLSGHLDDASACNIDRAEEIRPDRIAGEVEAARATGVRYVSPVDWLCTPTACPVVVGNLLVLRDPSHLKPPMAAYLRPLLEAALQPALP